MVAAKFQLRNKPGRVQSHNTYHLEGNVGQYAYIWVRERWSVKSLVLTH
jgi:hypothetical protein